MLCLILLVGMMDFQPFQRLQYRDDQFVVKPVLCLPVPSVIQIDMHYRKGHVIAHMHAFQAAIGFGEPAIRIEHLMQSDFSGRGVVSILDATTLYHSPRIYATFLLWLLSELMEELPERGDADLPRLVFFFDEAHLLFSSAPKALLERITQVVRLIRSKGVGVFFVTQYPNDVPDEVIGQLGNRIQHALRAFTPRDRKALKAAAETFRENPAFDTEQVIGQLGVGEALISTLDAKGVPSIVERTLMAPPRSQFGPVDDIGGAEGPQVVGVLESAGRGDHAVAGRAAPEQGGGADPSG